MNILNYITVITLSLLTTLIFICFILYSDRKSKEPKYMIFLCIISSIFTISLSLVLGQLLLPKLEIISRGLFDYTTQSILKISLLALVEEYSKLIVLYLFMSKSKSFDDVYDGFVYSSLIALSFAALESLLYVFSEPNFEAMKSLAILRSITTVPLHLICGTVMGYYIGKEKFTWGSKNRLFNLLMALSVPAFLHFVYNYTLTNIVARLSNSILLVPMVILFFSFFYLISYLYIKKTIFLNDKFKNNIKYKNLMTEEEYKNILK